MMPLMIKLDIKLVKKRSLHMFFSHNYAKIKIGLHDFLPQKKVDFA